MIERIVYTLYLMTVTNRIRWHRIVSSSILLHHVTASQSSVRLLRFPQNAIELRARSPETKHVSDSVLLGQEPCARSKLEGTANLHTQIMDFRGFDSIIILILRGGILMFIGDFQEILSQRILVGII